MKKKIALMMAAGGTALAMLPLLAAFEAHVVNVTATIENALAVSTEHLTFGTVFPQEKLDQFIRVLFSGSFLAQDRVNEVQYMLRQKPKCGLPVPNTNPVQYSAFGVVTENADGTYQCVDPGFVPLPLLCPYLSKHEITADSATGANNDPGWNGNGVGVNAFHGLPGVWNLATTVAYEVKGVLNKLAGDLDDVWNIDLKVPCFKGHCAQDWDEFVHQFNPTADPNAYVADPLNEHQLYGCDLWLEVNGINQGGPTTPQ